MSLRRRTRRAYTKRGGGLEERWEGVDGGIAYFRLLPVFFFFFLSFMFHIYDSNSLILYPGYYSGINNSPEKHQISLMLLNDVYVVVQFFPWFKFYFPFF